MDIDSEKHMPNTEINHEKIELLTLWPFTKLDRAFCFHKLYAGISSVFTATGKNCILPAVKKT